jgi:uncharacterized protein
MGTRLLVFQPTSLCNLNCSYCYVPDRQNLEVMSVETLRAGLQLFLPSEEIENPVTILWHAGEPLTAGLKFFQRASELIRECNVRALRIVQSIQTNATLLNDKWCDFLREEQFDVGVSVDGPAHIHDCHRRTLGGTATHIQVMRGIDLLKKHSIPLHGIAVLTEYSLNYPDEIFDFFLNTGFQTIGFNLEETEGAHVSFLNSRQYEPFSGLNAKYREFMDRLFDRWRTERGRPRIREFQDMSVVIGNFLQDQNFRRTPDDQIPFRNVVVSKRGDLSTFSPELAGGIPSDPTRFAIGNVHDVRSFDVLRTNSNFLHMDREIKNGVKRCEIECEYFPICGGGSCSNKFYERGTFDCAETLTCSLHRKVLATVVAEKLRRLSSQVPVMSA